MDVLAPRGQPSCGRLEGCSTEDGALVSIALWAIFWGVFFGAREAVANELFEHFICASGPLAWVGQADDLGHLWGHGRSDLFVRRICSSDLIQDKLSGEARSYQHELGRDFCGRY